MELDNRLQKAGADAVKKDDHHSKVVASLQAQLANAATSAGAAAAASAAAAVPAGQPAPAAAAALANGGPAPGAAAGDAGMLSRVGKQAAGLMQNIQNQAPGYARMLQDSFMGPQQSAAAAAMGGPEHVPLQTRNSMSGIQETELERKTRELQVGCTFCAKQHDCLLVMKKQNRLTARAMPRPVVKHVDPLASCHQP
jgi:hypothetical protein